MDGIVRLASLELSNIKNVKNGKIIMPNTYKKNMSYNNAEILGVYGQNGSGKTAVIDTLYFLQKIMIGSTLNEEMADYIDVNDNQARIVADFNIFEDNNIYEVTYRIDLQKNNKGVEIIQETLSCAINTGASRSNKTVFMDYNRKEKERIFMPKKGLRKSLKEIKRIEPI